MALVLERSVARFAAARLAASLAPGAGAAVGPLRLADVDPPALPGEGWHRVRPRLAGICGSDLATLDSRSSRFFEPIVSFPFVPGHEVVGDLEEAGAPLSPAVGPGG
ncbi:MAG: alcohol dehydrogenase catalytic domain-containing protein, partial [Acidimicrobiales bacterium]